MNLDGICWLKIDALLWWIHKQSRWHPKPSIEGDDVWNPFFTQPFWLTLGSRTPLLTVTNFVLKRYKNLYTGERDREKRNMTFLLTMQHYQMQSFAMVRERGENPMSGAHEIHSQFIFFSDLICNSVGTTSICGDVFEHLCSFLKSLLKRGKLST